MVGPFGGLGIALFGLVGITLIGIGGLDLRKWQTMRSMAPRDATAVDEGLQELEGHAHPVDDTVTAPFTGTEALICEYRVERHRHNDEGSDWHTITNETELVPFEVEHGGATVAVDPDNAQRLLTRELRLDTAGADDYPQGVQEYMDAGETVELGPVELDSHGGRLRFTEQRLDVGEEVYVLGSAERDPSVVPEGSDARTGIDPGERGLKEWFLGDPFIVSDSGEGQAERRQLKRGLFVLGIGVVLTGVALFAVFA